MTEHSILHLSRYYVKVVGPAKHFNETDWTAVEEAKERATEKVCGGYQVNGKTDVELPLFAEDLTVTVRDRITGEVLQTKTFESSMTCPSMSYGKLVAGPAYDAVPKWLASLIKKK